MKLESLKNYKKLNKTTLRNVVGGHRTNNYTPTNVPTNGGKDSTTNPTDPLGWSEDANDSTLIKTFLPPPTTDTAQSK